ncbi:TIGR02530 family flagellar biosynthesis protein [Halobacillus sp. ACCC02827]|uniref:TIGR02530 family flagellar biosynthesis protein n=1 Tax=Halobacillus sp. ACCC02827 TaxID=3052090 RepID=UPI002570D71F|nr:TIGR02530 family flagellar biosynthesis protein [Halobacillus sp. ACCC02827]WJE17472.1 TIGR02530 family flagellar biosynthesis protein [Halobacillus sp. ACCC02827]
MDPRIQALHRPLTIPKNAPVKNDFPSFRDVLEEAKEVKVSKHAKRRLEERNIDISEDMWGEIAGKMSEAKRKGITDSLIVTDDATLIVSTKNNTVVTALDREESASQIFTNINGTIFISK